MPAAPQQVAARPHGRGRAIRLGQHLAAQEHGDVLGLALIIFGLAAVDRLHREGVTKDEGNTLCSAKISEPVPGEDTLDIIGVN
jgi:hypothetical protein